MPTEAEQAIDPTSLSDAVIEAVRNDRPHMITHRAFRRRFEQQIDMVSQAIDRAFA